MQYQQQPNVGLMALQGLGGVAEVNQRAQQQQQRQDFQKKLGGFVSQNDRAGAQKLIAEYPQFMEEAQKQMGFIDTEQNKQTADAAMNLRLASQSKDPLAMQRAVSRAFSTFRINDRGRILRNRMLIPLPIRRRPMLCRVIRG